MLAACGGGQLPVTKTYNTSQPITIPAGVTNLVLLSGQGAAGQAEYDYYVQYFSDKSTVYNQRNDQGGNTNALDGGTTYNYGPTPTDYCTPHSPYIVNGVTNYTWTCHEYANLDYWETSPATTGASTTMTGPNGFTRTFAGGAGGPATNQSSSNVTVAPGQYQLNIPSGGSITLSYYE